ncbi:MAG: hypothetical protein P4L92_13720 [Rudaea sp.]|nr:hypothetical protein [Rudaea sp.]
MGKLFGRLVFLVVLVFGAGYAFKYVMTDRVADHFNTCHDDLHIGEKLKSADNEQLENVIAEYQACVLGKTTFVDSLYFGKKDIAKMMDALRMMNAK